MNHNMKQRLPYVFILLILVSGIGFLAYPTVSDWYCRYEARTEIAGYAQAVEGKDSSELDQMLADASGYNNRLSSGDTGGHNTMSSDDSSIAVSYNDLLAVTDAIGYLEIPKIGVYLPIYHGVEGEVLEKGIGHLPDSSLPVGGESTHCVLSGHSGLPAARILTELDRMEEGDRFYIHVLDRMLAYEVDQIKTVLPEETDDIQIVEGKDYVTLVTCVPYGVNTHRLLVRGERVEYTPGAVSVQAPAENAEDTPVAPDTLLIWLSAGAGVVLLIVILLILFIPTGKSKGRKD